jgi:hypothetical protein
MLAQDVGSLMYAGDVARDGNVRISNRERTYCKSIYHLTSTPNAAKARSSVANGTLSTSACAASIQVAKARAP